jgi:hypothetical protein
MKKQLIAGACIAIAGSLLSACSDSGTSVTKVQPKPPEDRVVGKVAPPESAVSEGLKATKEAPPDMPKKKVTGN